MSCHQLGITSHHMLSAGAADAKLQQKNTLGDSLDTHIYTNPLHFHSVLPDKTHCAFHSEVRSPVQTHIVWQSFQSEPLLIRQRSRGSEGHKPWQALLQQAPDPMASSGPGTNHILRHMAAPDSQMDLRVNSPDLHPSRAHCQCCGSELEAPTQAKH